MRFNPPGVPASPVRDMNLTDNPRIMKHNIRIAIVMASVLLFTPFAFAREKNGVNIPDHPIFMGGNPGIVISGSADKSQLPEKAQKFLSDFYTDDPIITCQENYIKQIYNLKLGDGTKITFDDMGDVVDISEGGNLPIGYKALKAILPLKVYVHLENSGFLNEVSVVKNAKGKGTCVMLLNSLPPQLIFDVDGVFVITAG